MNAWLLALVLAAPGGYDAYPTRLQGIRLQDEDLLVATFELRAYGSGWAYVPPSLDGAGNAVLAFPGGQRASLARTATQNGTKVNATFEAVPDQNVTIESVFAALDLPARVWAGGTVRVGSQTVTLPATSGGAYLFSGSATTVEFTIGYRKLSLSFPTSTSLYLQDSRQWGGGFELRMGGLGSGTWQAGQRVRVSLTFWGERATELWPEGPVTIQEGPNWVPLWPVPDVVPGSPLDFSPSNAAPAGSKGWLKVVNGKFAFENTPNVAERFLGPNLVFSCAYPSKTDADALAVRLRRMGYNCARLHHFDVDLTGGWRSSETGSSTNLDPQVLDRMDYLVSRLKANGIYVSLDLFTLRQVRRDEVIPGTIGTDEYKALLLVDQNARENWWAFARGLLEHVNPYTGLAWKDDPAIAWICVVNENNIASAYLSCGPTLRAKLDAAWRAAGNSGSFDPYTDAGARFGADLHRAAFQWMRDKLRSIGVKALLTDTNGWRNQQALVRSRVDLDYVDDHFYWDHPSFPQQAFALPSGHTMELSVRDFGGSLRNVAYGRMRGKPFTVSEFNYVFPNPFRSESGLFFGAVAAAQDWDGVWRFAWSHDAADIGSPGAANWFDLQRDPLRQAAERAVVSLYLWRHLNAAVGEATVLVQPNTAGAAAFSGPWVDPFAARWSNVQRSVNVPPPSLHPQIKIWLGIGTFAVLTPKTEGVFTTPGRTIRANRLASTPSGARAAVWVTALDDLPLPESRRMLFVHLTDLLNTGTRFSGPDRTMLEQWGSLPYLVRNGTANIGLTLGGTAKPTVYRLDLAGQRVGVVPSTWSGGNLYFRATVQGAPSGQATLYYEIVR